MGVGWRQAAPRHTKNRKEGKKIGSKKGEGEREEEGGEGRREKRKRREKESRED